MLVFCFRVELLLKVGFDISFLILGYGKWVIFRLYRRCEGVNGFLLFILFDICVMGRLLRMVSILIVSVWSLVRVISVFFSVFLIVFLVSLMRRF